MNELRTKSKEHFLLRLKRRLMQKSLLYRTGLLALDDSLNLGTNNRGSRLDSTLLQVVQTFHNPIVINSVNLIKVAEFLMINKKILILFLLLF